jgi:hypothetical protein
MPAGNLAAASPSSVFPQLLYTSFSEGRIYPGLFQTLHDGTPLASLITDGVNNPESIRTYTLTAKLTASQAATFVSFYEGLNGPLTPFFWYNPFEPETGQPIGSNYDSTGDSVYGRHTVKFTNAEWSEITNILLSGAPFSFLEVA